MQPQSYMPQSAQLVGEVLLRILQMHHITNMAHVTSLYVLTVTEWLSYQLLFAKFKETGEEAISLAL